MRTPKSPPSPKWSCDDLGQVAEQEQHSREPLLAQHLDQVLEERPPVELDHRLGAVSVRGPRRVPRPPARITACFGRSMNIRT